MSRSGKEFAEFRDKYRCCAYKARKDTCIFFSTVFDIESSVSNFKCNFDGFKTCIYDAKFKDPKPVKRLSWL